MTKFSCVVSTVRIRVYCYRYVILPLKLLAHAFLGKLWQTCLAPTEIVSFRSWKRVNQKHGYETRLLTFTSFYCDLFGCFQKIYHLPW